MKKFFNKELAEKFGYGVAVHLLAVYAELRTELDRMPANGKAQVIPEFEQHETADEVEFRRMMAEGHKFDLDVEEWTLKG